MGAVPPAVPSAISRASGSAPVSTTAQRGPYQPVTGKSVVPEVPRTEQPGEAEMAWQPSYATAGTTGRTLESGSAGAPSVPVDGFLFKRGPVDPHYTAQSGPSPYARVNAPQPPRPLGIIKSFINGIFQGRQNVDEAGWQQRAPQQRTSYMRVTALPSGEGGYAPETYVPRQLPQQPYTQRFLPVLGSSQPGVVPGQGIVLNRATFGAGQTAGGIGGNQYTPAPGPPDTTSTAGQPQQASGMPTWG